MSETLYKVTADDGSAYHGGTGRWTLGEWRTVKGELVGVPACSCGGYDSADESNPAEAWRAHLTAAVLALIDAACEPTPTQEGG